MNETDRLPICKGFSISFSRDGRAIAHGKNDADAIQYLQDLLDDNAALNRRETIEFWISKKVKEIIEAESERDLLARRNDAEEEIERAIRKTRLRGKLAELVRKYALASFGISEHPD